LQHRFCKIAKYVGNSRLFFARTFILAENNRLRSSQPSKAVTVSGKARATETKTQKLAINE
jgi:hypothetical protein